MDNLHLESVIEDSISDAALPDEPTEVQADAPSDPVEPVETPAEPAQEEAPVEAADAQVKSPAAKVEAKPVDDFEKKFGIPEHSATGRENRIPYTRVKKITERAVSDAKAQFSKELETTHVPVTKYQELETKVKTEYEPRLAQVAEFEKVMMNEPPRFLDMLATIPAYAKIFKELQAQAQPQAPVQEAKVEADDPRPEPDQELTDGSFVYSMEGLDKLNAWNRAQARKEIMKEVETRFGPLENDYKRYQEQQAALPAVQAQIAEARTWKLFNENEEDIIKVLQKYPSASLERAYQHVVFPKLEAEQERLRKEVEAKAGEAKVSRESIRAEILAELKRAPKSTSVSQAGAPKPNSATGGAPKSLEEIIADSVKTIKR